MWMVGQNFTELDDIQYIKTGNTLRILQVPVQKGVNTITRGVVHLDVNDPGVVNELLTVLNEYPMCIATNMSELGETKTVEMKIELTSTQPIFHGPRRYAESERRGIKELVEELLRNGVIRESSSPYASPVLLVSKKSGEKRLYVDYRALNKLTVRDRYTLPQIEEQLGRLSGYNYFTSLDLFAGYHQVPMSSESLQYTSFVTQDGQYEYLRMPFGLCNAPAVFQRMINHVLGQYRFSKVLCYLDDILLPADRLNNPWKC
jgi:hypothetical protein